MTAPHPTFVDDRLAHWAATTPGAEAMTYLGRTWTWAGWEDRVRRAAGALRGLGVGRGDVVAFLDKNHPACVELSLAAASLGAANAIVNWRLAEDEVRHTLDDCRARVLVVGSELAPLVGAVRDRLPHLRHVVEVTPDGGEGDGWEAMLAGAEPVGRDPAVEPDDVCLVMYSSGTTGRPKGVMLTQAAMVAHTLAAHDGWEFRPGEKSMVAMPLFHVGGSSYVLFGLHDGIPSVMTREPDAASLGGAILAGATATFLVPAVLAQVLRSGPEAVALFGRLTTYTYGAAPMPLPLLREAMEAWPDTDFIQVYGLTEVAGVATHLLPETHREAMASGRHDLLVSAGRPLPGVEVRVVSPDTLTDVGTDAPGELWLRTPQLMKGFLGRPEETAAAVTEDGWFRTGDLGRVDAEGYVFVEDRLKDLIITGGENVYGPEVERVLAEHPAVAEVAVIGVPHDRWGETVKAVVSLRPGASATPAELIEHCRTLLAGFKAPTSVDVLAVLPRNPTGKILKRELRRPYWADRDRAVL